MLDLFRTYGPSLLILNTIANALWGVWVTRNLRKVLREYRLRQWAREQWERDQDFEIKKRDIH